MSYAELDFILQKSIADMGIPSVVAIVANKEEILYEESFGQIGKGSRQPISMDTVFWIASMTKVITTTAALQLVERGLLQLHEPVSKVLPDINRIPVLAGFDEDGNAILRKAENQITLHHLLAHTAGFVYDMWNEDIVAFTKERNIPGIIQCKNETLEKTPAVFNAGKRWEYGINIEWVGKVVEAVSGQSLRDYMLKHILLPLGMNDTDFLLSEEQRARLAKMHVRDEDGRFHAIDFEMTQEPEFFMGGGGLYSTAGDYMKFMQMLLNDGTLNEKQILQPQTVKMMMTNQIGDLNMHPLITAIPSSTNNVNFFPEMIKKWGYGFMINTEDVPGGRRASSLAWAGLGNTYFWIDPVERIAAVFMTQILPFADEDVLDVFSQFEKAVYRHLL
ncbi:beta-lactamase family protein [Bacillus sp. AGMB 02131]|uniref:Beta-lactamase family protein n=1 Tax=Peribacillus faecalis TaxID=2772559 RepID=A0A927CZC7_9BACI|nr:serine hydrolase domain-containing protein [Peribacillus faecalis]MBD3110462.1 beta-lactamase family protein [Peribacillus faecalis]